MEQKSLVRCHRAILSCLLSHKPKKQVWDSKTYYQRHPKSSHSAIGDCLVISAQEEEALANSKNLKNLVMVQLKTWEDQWLGFPFLSELLPPKQRLKLWGAAFFITSKLQRRLLTSGNWIQNLLAW
jgi:hypothetical protein